MANYVSLCDYLGRAKRKTNIFSIPPLTIYSTGNFFFKAASELHQSRNQVVEESKPTPKVPLEKLEGSKAAYLFFFAFSFRCCRQQCSCQWQQRSVVDVSTISIFAIAKNLFKHIPLSCPHTLLDFCMHNGGL